MTLATPEDVVEDAPETAVEGLRPHRSFGGRPREADRRKRKPLGWWDRVKFLTLLGSLLLFFFWQNLGDNPIKSVPDAFFDTLSGRRWLIIVGGFEIARQLHYFIAEHWSWYYLFFKRSIFGKLEARVQRTNPWNRYRIARVAKIFMWLTIASLIVSAATGDSAFTALVTLPSRFISWLPMILRVVMLMMILVLQFAAIFFFLSRGGVQTYFPDDIDTRFDDVWGQDAVVEKVQENLLFLEDPDSIEAIGGYTPGGILLWGPPGTGKTLMAEASAGETGKPFVFVDPGAFINMFMGVGILKVKSLFRKLRKLSVRYGGVVVFFDEADALGNRGAPRPGTGRRIPVRRGSQRRARGRMRTRVTACTT